MKCSLLSLCALVVWGGLSSAAESPEALLDAGHAKRARALLQPLLQANPNDARLNHLMSRAATALDDADLATRTGERSIALAPDNADYHTHLARVYGWQATTGSYFHQLRCVQALKRELDSAQRLNPKQPDTYLIRAVFLTVAPSLVGGDRQQAQTVLDQLTALYPERGHIARARVAEKRNDLTAILTGYRQALAVNPHSYPALLGLGRFLCCAGSARLDEAERYGRTLVQLAPSRIGGYQVLARVLAATGRYAELDPLLTQAERAVPDDLSPYFYAAKELLAQGKELPRAEQYIRRHLSQPYEGDQPSTAEGHWILAQLREQQGQRNGAIAALETAIRLRPDWDVPKKELRRLRN